MPQHHELGDAAIPVGFYTSSQTNEQKKRYRTIGVLMETTEDDGSRRQWLKLNLDVLHPSLFALARTAAKVPAGEDRITVAIFPPRENRTAPQDSAPPQDEVF